MKTAGQIERDVLRMLHGSELEEAVSGGLYRGWNSPKNGLENIEVRMQAADAEEIATAQCRVVVFVSDIDPYGNGLLVPDTERIDQLQQIADRWARSLTADKSEYRVRLGAAVTSVADEQAGTHLVSVPLTLQCFNR